MGGGSMIVSGMQYRDSQPPKKPWEPPDTYIAPEESLVIQPTYDFIRTHLATDLPQMKPVDSGRDGLWCLAEEGRQYLVLALEGNSVSVDLSGAPSKRFRARWFDPRTGNLTPAGDGLVTGGGEVTFARPDNRWHVLWLNAAGQF